MAISDGKDELATGRVLVVDDDAFNRELLRCLLEADGHEVLEAEDGARGLALAAELCPHAVLLDVVMRDLDGFEVCRRLKADPVTAAIPVLLVTALDDCFRLQGIEVGATDYLTKPPDPHDVVLRTRNAVRVKRLYDRTRDDLEKVHALESLRDSLTPMFVPDAGSPLTALLDNLRLLETGLGDRLEGDHRASLEQACAAAGRLAELLRTLLDVSRLGGPDPR